LPPSPLRDYAEPLALWTESRPCVGDLRIEQYDRCDLRTRPQPLPKRLSAAEARDRNGHSRSRVNFPTSW